MTPREQFRLGFLLRCADEGLTTEQIGERVKQAAAFSLKDLWPILKGTLGFMVKAPLTIGAAGLGLSAGVGGAGGLMAAKAMNEDIDPEEIRKQELMAAYRQHAERARRNAAKLTYRKPTVRASRF